ncbi:MAG: divergent polysaccharide deacetylase family protein [bacterium]|nr:divergent polysaccharide deacetylase family protein [bacterium]
MAKKRRTYKPKKTVRRTSSKTTVRRRRTAQENKTLQTIARALRLIIIFVFSGFLIYFLFKPDHKPQPDQTAEIQNPATAVDTVAQDETPEIEPTINLDALSQPELLEYWLHQILRKYQITDKWVGKRNREITVQLPTDLPPIEVVVDVIQKLTDLGWSYVSSEENLKRSRQSLTVISHDDTLATIVFIVNKNFQRATHKIAIIIDDFGYYNNQITQEFLELDYPINLSVIPGQKFSRSIAHAAVKNRKPVMVHLPMEAEEQAVEQNRFTIMTTMTDAEIVDRVQKALKAIPNAVALNNHMGSKATADRRVMDILFRELAQREIMFIDSRTTTKSVADQMAQQHQIRYHKRTIFLDGVENHSEDYIRNQLLKAAKIAERRGNVVVIGHPYKETLAVLKQQLPLLEKRGIVVIPVTDLLK